MLHRRDRLVLAVGVVCTVTFASLGLLRRRDPQPVLYTVALPQTSYGVALDTRTGRAFIAGASLATGTGSVWVYNLRTGHLIRTLGPFSPNVEVTVIAPLQRAFVTDSSGLVSMLDSRSGRVLGTTVAGGDPTFSAVAARHGWLVLTNPNRDSIDVVDVRTGREVRSIYLALSATPKGVWVDDRTGHIISANSGTHSVSVIDPTRGMVLRTVAVGISPWVVVDSRRGRVFVTTARGVLLLDATSGRALRTIPVQVDAARVGTLTIDEHSGHAFISSTQAVSMVDTRTGRLLRTIHRPGGVVGIDDRRDWVYLWGTGGLSVLDGQTGAPISTMVGGLSADVVAISPRRRRVLVASTTPAGNMSGPAIARLVDIASGTVLWSRAVGVGPVALALDDQAGYALVLTEGGTVKSADPLRWLPRWARRLPFIPAPPPAQHTIPAQMTVLDLSR